MNYEKILDDFFNSLRLVGVSYSEKELSNKTIEQIAKVKNLFQVIRDHEINYAPLSTKLSNECNWDLDRLLQDILKYPQVIPRVRQLNGQLHYVFKEPIPPPPLDKDIKHELLQLASKIVQIEKRIELVSLINNEESLLYVTSELSLSNDLNVDEREKAKDLFGYFY